MCGTRVTFSRTETKFFAGGTQVEQGQIREMTAMQFARLFPHRKDGYTTKSGARREPLDERALWPEAKWREVYTKQANAALDPNRKWGHKEADEIRAVGVEAWVREKMAELYADRPPIGIPSIRYLVMNSSPPQAIDRVVKWERTERPTTCGAKCRNAKGPMCDCVCEGKFHGAGTAMSRARFSEIDLKPTQEMAEAAARGLELREKHGKGGTAVGVARARDIKNRANLSPDTVRRMNSFFARHEGNQSGGEDDAGYIAWLLWGGDPGKAWATRKAAQLDKIESTRVAERKTTMKREYVLWALPKGETDRLHEQPIAHNVTKPADMERIKHEATQRGWHSFRVQVIEWARTASGKATMAKFKVGDRIAYKPFPAKTAGEVVEIREPTPSPGRDVQRRPANQSLEVQYGVRQPGGAIMWIAEGMAVKASRPARFSRWEERNQSGWGDLSRSYHATINGTAWEIVVDASTGKGTLMRATASGPKVVREGTVDQLKRYAETAKASRPGAKAAFAGSEEIIHSFNDGWAVVKRHSGFSGKDELVLTKQGTQGIVVKSVSDAKARHDAATNWVFRAHVVEKKPNEWVIQAMSSDGGYSLGDKRGNPFPSRANAEAELKKMQENYRRKAGMSRPGAKTANTKEPNMNRIEMTRPGAKDAYALGQAAAASNIDRPENDEALRELCKKVGGAETVSLFARWSEGKAAKRQFDLRAKVAQMKSMVSKLATTLGFKPDEVTGNDQMMHILFENQPKQADRLAAALRTNLARVGVPGSAITTHEHHYEDENTTYGGVWIDLNALANASGKMSRPGAKSAFGTPDEALKVFETLAEAEKASMKGDRARMQSLLRSISAMVERDRAKLPAGAVAFYEEMKAKAGMSRPGAKAKFANFIVEADSLYSALDRDDQIITDKKSAKTDRNTLRKMREAYLHGDYPQTARQWSLLSPGSRVSSMGQALKTRLEYAGIRFSRPGAKARFAEELVQKLSGGWEIVKIDGILHLAKGNEAIPVPNVQRAMELHKASTENRLVKRTGGFM